MEPYLTGAVIRRLREEKRVTQQQLAEAIGVSDKAASRWETGRGYPDISLLEPLAAALGVSVAELFDGKTVVNTNRSCNMLRSKIYVCPICGNVMIGTGEAVVSCCGIRLPALEAEEADEAHAVTFTPVEDEFYVTLSHEMTKTHYISFLLAVRDDGCELTKLYPEGSAEARFKTGRTRALYVYCNRHGLFRVKVERKKP